MLPETASLGAIVAKLDAMHEDLRELKQATREHDQVHNHAKDGIAHRLTKLEGTLSNRTVWGGLGVVLSGLAGMFVRPGGT